MSKRSSPPVDPTASKSPFQIDDRWRIPLGAGDAVSPGWLAHTGYAPVGVTWHWTRTATLRQCSELLGGAAPSRRGQASAHYGIGRSFAEGVDRYVSLEDRSWHAGVAQSLRWDGQLMESQDWKGARTTIGIETVTEGFARPGRPAEPDWIRADSPRGGQRMRVQPWTEEQIVMMIAIGRQIQARWPNLGPRDHHGHHDLCPGYKVDVVGFPFARVLRGIYDDPSIPDVWSSVWTVEGRRAALRALGWATGPGFGGWSRFDDLDLRRFQASVDLPANGVWTTAVSWRVHEKLTERGLAPAS